MFRKLPGFSYFSILIMLLAFSITAQNNPPKQPEKKPEKTADGEAEKEKKAEDELARIAIVPFQDRTNSKNFLYLSESLVDAINKSMYKEFTFVQINPKEIKKAVFDAEQDVLKKKLAKGKKSAKQEPAPKAPEKKPEVKEEKTAQTDKKGDVKEEGKQEEKPVRVKTAQEIAMDDDQLVVMQAVAKTLPAEIVIYGNYTYDNQSNEIIFSVKIYMAATKTTREIADTKNPVDNTIFKATTEVAKSLVEEIHKMVEEAQKSMVASTEQKKEEAQPGKKLSITRKIASAPVLDWNAKKFAFILTHNIGLIPDFKTVDWEPVTNDPDMYDRPPMGELKFWLTPNFTLSLLYKNLKYRTVFTDGLGMEVAWHEFEFHQVMAFAGIGYIYQKTLRPYLELGAGYYWGRTDSNYSSGSGGSTDYHDDIKNPVFGAKIGYDLLLLPNLMAGVNLMYCYLYDEPEPVHSLDLNLSMGIIF